MISKSKAQRLLWLFGLFKIPMIGFVSPKIVQLDNEKIVIRIGHKRRSINHLGSIYLGALVIGADLAAGFHAFAMGKELNKNISIVFKNIRGDFHSRPMSDVYFVGSDGLKIKSMIESSIKTGERYTEDILISVYTKYPEDPEHIADFTLGLSVKNK